MKSRVRQIVINILTPLAGLLLTKHTPKVIAITGSVGKTSTKRAIAAAVETTHKTQWHEGNYNSDIGLPLAIFEIKSPTNTSNPFAWIGVLFRAISKLLFWKYPYELLVLEFGIDHVGEMDGFLSIVTPDIGVVTAIQGAHLEGLGSIDVVYREKIKLAEHAKHALVNFDDDLLQSRFIASHPDEVTYGLSTGSTYQITKVQRQPDGTLSLAFDGHDLKTHFVAQYQLLGLAAAWGVARMLDISPGAITQNLSELEPYAGRMNTLRGKKGSIILDDSYNNVSVDAAKAAITTLVDFPGQRHILVFGTMNEMGDQAEAGHREVAIFAAAQELDYIVTIGDSARSYFADELKRHGVSEDKIASFLSPYEAGHHLAGKLKKGDVILVKGSQNKVFAEEATALLLELDSDRSQLVRQSSSWQKIKHSQFN